jgi:3-dehydroquinate dehydratase II
MVMTLLKILVLHGPNLNLLGRREPEVYGKVTIEQINAALDERAIKLGAELVVFQSNHEGMMVDRIQEAATGFDGILINPAAFTHYSYALREALAAAALPLIEVHLSNIFSREKFRSHSVVSPVAAGMICGLGINSYLLGLEALVDLIRKGLIN